ncbi:uncharacterized protein TERG_11733 [Trichophyton rubrum CBS 118892]|uniref:Uncharacterized protein n=1 Tax=Trichophyton rubrum (strain ATCC MYA-4607 / CBS 118892) TaxID=559305 RepID=A0A080WH78_TRIRC|nr:uncharacterized protein TERG_11733 [Trichophyton rubrum CBS 118892]KFL60634.1 hypothetical protein TERG_11733 [Trichophyton rubrum CBS 118892]
MLVSPRQELRIAVTKEDLPSFEYIGDKDSVASVVYLRLGGCCQGALVCRHEPHIQEFGFIFLNLKLCENVRSSAFNIVAHKARIRSSGWSESFWRVCAVGSGA